MQRIVFINLHANEFLLKPLNKYIWKQSCAFKHKYFLEYLLQNSDIEVCNYINEDGFTLVKSFPKPVMWFLDKLRFVESSITMRKNELNHKGIMTLKSVSEIRPDDIVIGYRHVPSSLMDMDQIHAFKIVHMCFEGLVAPSGNCQDNNVVRLEGVLDFGEYRECMA